MKPSIRTSKSTSGLTSQPLEIDHKRLRSLHTNQRLLVEELQRRGVSVKLLLRELELLEARFGDHVEFIQDRDSSLCPRTGILISENKYLTKKILDAAQLAVCQGELFYPEQMDDALNYAKSLACTLILKPVCGSHGLGFSANIKGAESLTAAIHNFTHEFGKNQAFILEEQFNAQEYRVFITRNGSSAVLRRDPASIVGDGTTSIKNLISTQNYVRSKRMNCLCPIIIDATVVKTLEMSNLNLDSVPKAGEHIYLRYNSNVASGGMCEDVTDSIHPSLVTVAYEALKCIHGLPYAGIDILSTDPSVFQTPETYRILEVNANPGFAIHARPGLGKSRNVASFVVDMIFPETCNNRLEQLHDQAA